MVPELFPGTDNETIWRGDRLVIPPFLDMSQGRVVRAKIFVTQFGKFFNN